MGYEELPPHRQAVEAGKENAKNGGKGNFNSKKQHIDRQRRESHHEAEVVIVGAGILGSALAVALADQGRSVILLEKSLKEPDRIVGELLQPGGVQALAELGLADCLEGIDAVKVKGYSVRLYDQVVLIPYPHSASFSSSLASSSSSTGEGESGGESESKGKSQARAEGRAFHHGRFVSNLRARALAHPNVTVFETEATAPIFAVSGVGCDQGKADEQVVLGVRALTTTTTTTTNKDTAERQAKRSDYFFGDLTIAADGYASKFRKADFLHNDSKKAAASTATTTATTTPVAKSRFWGLELIDCTLPHVEHGLVNLSDQAPVLFYQIGSHETRVLVDIPEGTPTASVAAGGVKSHLKNVVLPTLPPQTQAAFLTALEKDNGRNLRSMPNSFLAATTRTTTRGFTLLGDALNMRHPLTGGGMTVALNDVVLISRLLCPESVPDLSNTTLVCRQLTTFHWQRKQYSAVINILAQALYSLFAAPPDDVEMTLLQRACFAYFQRGGICIDGPVGLLAGLIRQPLVLFYHFFAVALLAIASLFRDNGLLRFPLSIVLAVRVFWKACVVIFPYIFAELKL